MISDQVQIILGSTVRWRSQARGAWKEKTGRVIDVVPAGRYPDRKLAPDLYYGFGLGFARKNKSYVVRVKTGANSFKHYWPRVTALSIVDK